MTLFDHHFVVIILDCLPPLWNTFTSDNLKNTKEVDLNTHPQHLVEKRYLTSK